MGTVRERRLPLLVVDLVVEAPLPPFRSAYDGDGPLPVGTPDELRLRVPSPEWVFAAHVAAVDSATDAVLARLIGGGGVLSLHWQPCEDLIPVLKRAIRMQQWNPLSPDEQAVGRAAAEVLRVLSEVAYAVPLGRLSVSSETVRRLSQPRALLAG